MSIFGDGYFKGTRPIRKLKTIPFSSDTIVSSDRDDLCDNDDDDFLLCKRVGDFILDHWPVSFYG